MNDLYIVEGGLGKNIAFTALTPKLLEKSGGPVYIAGSFHEVFYNNPYIEGCFNSSMQFCRDPRLKNVRNIYGAEPYKSNFLHGNQSLIEGFCSVLGVKYSPDMLPRLYTESAAEKTKKWLETNKIDGHYVLVQFTGGQNPAATAQNQQYQSINPGRNYPYVFAKKLVERLTAAGVKVIDCTLPNEPAYPGAVKCFEHWSVVHELMKGSRGFIGIDSYLNHMSGSAGCSGIVIWGNTSATQFGYGHNKNLQFHMEGKWDDSKCDLEDPRNIMVDPDLVMDAYVKQRIVKTIPKVA